MDDILKNNPLFMEMDPEKIEFLMNFAKTSKPTNIKDAIPFLMANMNLAKNNNINFTKPEIQLIVDLLSKDLSQTEKNKINRIMSMMIK